METEGDYAFVVSETVKIGSDVRNDYQQAVVLLEAERINEGIALLESVVERAPDITIPHIDLGVAYMRTGELDKAEASLTEALSLAPNHPAALNEMGILQRKAGRFARAREYYERVLAIHPNYHFALRNLGVLCDIYLDDLPCALTSYEQYAAIVTDDAEVGIWIADIRNRLPAEEG
jgi:Flp pilus assembly protein TadD